MDLAPSNAQSKPKDDDAAARPAVEPAQSAVHARKGAKIVLAGALPPAQIPAEALASPRHDRLLIAALSVSIAIHGVIAILHFSPFDFSRISSKEPPLSHRLPLEEIILCAP